VSSQSLVDRTRSWDKGIISQIKNSFSYNKNNKTPGRAKRGRSTLNLLSFLLRSLKLGNEKRATLFLGVTTRTTVFKVVTADG